MRVKRCLINENSYWGGQAAFSALHGGGDYHSSVRARDEFKHLLSHLVNRKNHYTGLA